MKTKVYSMIHNHGEVGDFIHCSNCGAYSFLRCGDDRCPVCGEEGKMGGLMMKSRNSLWKKLKS